VRWPRHYISAIGPHALVSSIGAEWHDGFATFLLRWSLVALRRLFSPQPTMTYPRQLDC